MITAEDIEKIQLRIYQLEATIARGDQLMTQVARTLRAMVQEHDIETIHEICRQGLEAIPPHYKDMN